MMSKQVGEEITLRQSHIEKQKELLLGILTSKYHDNQRKELLSKQEVEMKELRSSQTKASLQHKRQFSSSDRTTSKAEADRRMKEINENNTKKFSIERQRLQSQHNLQLEYLKKSQNQELQQITRLCDEEKTSITKEYSPEILEKIETVI